MKSSGFLTLAVFRCSKARACTGTCLRLGRGPRGLWNRGRRGGRAPCPAAPSGAHPDLIPGRGHRVHWGADAPSSRDPAARWGVLYCHHVRLEASRLGGVFPVLWISCPCSTPHGTQEVPSPCPQRGTLPGRAPHSEGAVGVSQARGADPHAGLAQPPAGCSRGLMGEGPQAALPDPHSPGTGWGPVPPAPPPTLVQHPSLSRTPGWSSAAGLLECGAVCRGGG